MVSSDRFTASISTTLILPAGTTKYKKCWRAEYIRVKLKWGEAMQRRASLKVVSSRSTVPPWAACVPTLILPEQPACLLLSSLNSLCAYSYPAWTAWVGMCLLLSSVQLSECGCAYSEHTLVKCQEYSDSVHCIRVQRDHPAACLRLFIPSSTVLWVQLTTFEFNSLHLSSVCVRGCFLLRDSLASQDPLTPLYHRSYITDTDSSYMTKPNRAN